MKESLKNQAGRLVFGGILFLGCLDLVLQRFFRARGFGIENRGVSFGTFQGIGWELLLAVWIALLILLWRSRHKGLRYRIPLWLMIVGGAVNLLERSSWGGVWDYLGISWVGLWFNLSDVMIVSGLGFIALRK